MSSKHLEHLNGTQKVKSWKDDLASGKWKRSKSAYQGFGKRMICFCPLFPLCLTFFDNLTERVAPGNKYEPESGRYHLYLAHACPWATRTNMTRLIYGLEDHVSISFAHPEFGPIDEAGATGWVFDNDSELFRDDVCQQETLMQVYQLGNPNHDSKATTPLLFDKKTRTNVSNESTLIFRDMALYWKDFGTHPEVDLYPSHLAEKIDRFIDGCYDCLLDGVYRAGFTIHQDVYEEIVTSMFAKLDEIEEILKNQRYLMGSVLSLADLVLYPTLFRFDAIYVVHFKCSIRRIKDYPNMLAWLQEMNTLAPFSQANDLKLTKQHYFCSHIQVNPYQRIPLVDLDYYYLDDWKERAKRLPASHLWWFQKEDN